MGNDIEIGELVLDSFEVVKYLGYEEHEDDNYHKLLSLERGEYLMSAVCGPRKFIGTEGYTEALRMWELNSDRMLSNLQNGKRLLEEYILTFKVYEPIINLGVWDNMSIKFFDSRLDFDYFYYVNIDSYKLEYDEQYKDYLTSYIHAVIKQQL